MLKLEFVTCHTIWSRCRCLNRLSHGLSQATVDVVLQSSHYSVSQTYNHFSEFVTKGFDGVRISYDQSCNQDFTFAPTQVVKISSLTLNYFVNHNRTSAIWLILCGCDDVTGLGGQRRASSLGRDLKRLIWALIKIVS